MSYVQMTTECEDCERTFTFIDDPMRALITPSLCHTCKREREFERADRDYEERKQEREFHRGKK